MAASSRKQAPVASVLGGVICFVHVATEDVNASGSIARKLSQLGAKCTHLTKDVTHIIFKGDPGALRRIYDKAHALNPDCPALVLSPLWVQKSEDEMRRSLERPFIIPRPQESEFQYLQTPKPSAKRKRKSMQPKAYDVDLSSPVFSSTQQLQAMASPGKGEHPVPMSDAKPPASKRRKAAGGAIALSSPPPLGRASPGEEDDGDACTPQLLASARASHASTRTSPSLASGGPSLLAPSLLAGLVPSELRMSLLAPVEEGGSGRGRGRGRGGGRGRSGYKVARRATTATDTQQRAPTRRAPRTSATPPPAVAPPSSLQGPDGAVPPATSAAQHLATALEGSTRTNTVAAVTIAKVTSARANSSAALNTLTVADTAAVTPAASAVAAAPTPAVKATAVATAVTTTGAAAIANTSRNTAAATPAAAMASTPAVLATNLASASGKATAAASTGAVAAAAAWAAALTPASATPLARLPEPLELFPLSPVTVYSRRKSGSSRPGSGGSRGESGARSEPRNSPGAAHPTAGLFSSPSLGSSPICSSRRAHDAAGDGDDAGGRLPLTPVDVTSSGAAGSSQGGQGGNGRSATRRGRGGRLQQRGQPGQNEQQGQQQGQSTPTLPTGRRGPGSSPVAGVGLGVQAVSAGPASRSSLRRRPSSAPTGQPGGASDGARPEPGGGGVPGVGREGEPGMGSEGDGSGQVSRGRKRKQVDTTLGSKPSDGNATEGDARVTQADEQAPGRAGGGRGRKGRAGADASNHKGALASGGIAAVSRDARVAVPASAGTAAAPTSPAGHVQASHATNKDPFALDSQDVSKGLSNDSPKELRNDSPKDAPRNAPTDPFALDSQEERALMMSAGRSRVASASRSRSAAPGSTPASRKTAGTEMGGDAGGSMRAVEMTRGGETARAGGTGRRGTHRSSHPGSSAEAKDAGQNGATADAGPSGVAADGGHVGAAVVTTMGRPAKRARLGKGAASTGDAAALVAEGTTGPGPGGEGEGADKDSKGAVVGDVAGGDHASKVAKVGNASNATKGDIAGISAGGDSASNAAGGDISGDKPEGDKAGGASRVDNAGNATVVDVPLAAPVAPSALAAGRRGGKRGGARSAALPAAAHGQASVVLPAGAGDDADASISTSEGAGARPMAAREEMLTLEPPGLPVDAGGRAARSTPTAAKEEGGGLAALLAAGTPAQAGGHGWPAGPGGEGMEPTPGGGGTGEGGQRLGEEAAPSGRGRRRGRPAAKPKGSDGALNKGSDGELAEGGNESAADRGDVGNGRSGPAAGNKVEVDRNGAEVRRNGAEAELGGSTGGDGGGEEEKGGPDSETVPSSDVEDEGEGPAPRACKPTTKETTLSTNVATSTVAAAKLSPPSSSSCHLSASSSPQRVAALRRGGRPRAGKDKGADGGNADVSNTGGHGGTAEADPMGAATSSQCATVADVRRLADDSRLCSGDDAALPATPSAPDDAVACPALAVPLDGSGCLGSGLPQDLATVAATIERPVVAIVVTETCTLSSMAVGSDVGAAEPALPPKGGAEVETRDAQGGDTGDVGDGASSVARRWRGRPARGKHAGGGAVPSAVGGDDAGAACHLVPGPIVAAEPDSPFTAGPEARITAEAPGTVPLAAAGDGAGREEEAAVEDDDKENRGARGGRGPQRNDHWEGRPNGKKSRGGGRVRSGGEVAVQVGAVADSSDKASATTATDATSVGKDAMSEERGKGQEDGVQAQVDSEAAKQAVVCAGPEAAVLACSLVSPAPARTGGSRGAKKAALSVTSCEPGTLDLLRVALSTLGGFRLVTSDGTAAQEHVTHLVAGCGRRTIKLLFAISRGAWVLTPEWVSRSLEKGCWVPEEGFEADYYPGIRLSRAANDTHASKGGGGRLLSSMRVAIAEKGTQPARDVLKKLVENLGGKVVAAASAPECDVLITGGDRAKVAASHPGVHVVREQWLLAAIEAYQVPPFE
eukprot:jgi/Mesvir1/20337/Mv19926-RA.1